MNYYIMGSESHSVRLFRVYHIVPECFYLQYDEVIYIPSVKGTFSTGNKEKDESFKTGNLIIFPCLEVHAMPCIIEYSVVFLTIDTPYRAPGDVVLFSHDEDYTVPFIKKIDGVQL